MLSLQQKGELHRCSLEPVANSTRVYIFFFFSASTSATAIQESVQYHHGDTLPILEL